MAATTLGTPRRIFWLGMHKVLKPTELRHLRELGFEVFNPAYISPVYDQSADLRIDLDQPTTLPKAVFDQLIGYDFFYRGIEPHIAEILNTYFDAAIVTISANWLREFALAYKGPIVYRVYGQHFSLSDVLVGQGIWPLLMARENFTIVPFAAESVENEHRWFLDMCSEPVPYQIPDDVFSAAKWKYEDRRPEVAVSLPNVQNPYFADAYERFFANHKESYFRLYGPQRATPSDPRIIGALPRGEFLERLRRSSAYYYDYRDSVAYLPPIEMMQMGGPVVCAQGSLLSRFLGKDAPNVAQDTDDARSKLRRLMRGDPVFSAELIAAQEATRQRYDPEIVKPAFARVVGSILSGNLDKPATAKFDGPLVRGASADQRPKTIAMALHADGLFEHVEGRPYAFEGIPRVADVIVKVATTSADVECEVACTRRAAPIIYDFFIDEVRSGAVSLHLIDTAQGRDEPACVLERLAWARALDERPNVTSVMAPHYYLFPELLLCDKRVTLYLPDYFPHLAPDEVFDQTAEIDARNKEVGIALAQKADRILTNSEFTKAYLPDAGFTVDRHDPKVVVAPLPFLGADRAVEPTAAEQIQILERLSGRPFLFYPTANRPNKKMAFLMEVFAELRFKHPSLGLVLTCDINTYVPARQAVERLELQDDIHYFPRSSEGLLRWFYKNTVALCLTSNLEGNFPPQVLEALNYEAPVVATRLPTMTEILGDRADQLLLCPPNDRDAFLSALEEAMDNRADVLLRQAEVVRYLRQWNSLGAFKSKLADVFPEIAASGAV